MGKQWRKCSICGVDSYNRPDLVIFSVLPKYKTSTGHGSRFICELHYDKDDMRAHQGSKRLVRGATPKNDVPQASQEQNIVDCNSAELDSLFEPDEDSDCSDVEVDENDFMEQMCVGVSESGSSQSSYATSCGSGSQNVSSQESKADSQPTRLPGSQKDDGDSDVLEDSIVEESTDLSGKTLLASWSSIEQLLAKCRREGCSSGVLPENMRKVRNGASVTVYSTCDNGHEEVWTSSESVKAGKFKMPLVNLSIICYLFFSGIHWSQFMAFSQKINLLMVSTSTFYRFLRKLIYPCTYDFWLQDQAKSINSIVENQNSGQAEGKFAGDGRFDSPGWSAKFCTYFIQDLASRKVVALMVVCKNQAGIKYSAAMEVFALRSLLNHLLGCGVKILFLVTDRSTTVRALMTEEFPTIGHQFDIWHFIKGIKNRLLKAAKLASCKNLKLWLSSIVNMLWWSLATAKGCPETARQKVLSIMHHTSNNHVFPAFHLFGRCEHEDIVQEKRPWIDPKSMAMQKLRTAICGDDNKNLDDLKYMTEFVHTGDIESLNNLQLKYANKKYSYSWLGMIMRACLCALDWNANVDRPQKKDASGRDMYREKVNRYGDVRTVVPVLVAKDTTWQDMIFDSCVDSLEKDRIPSNEFPIEELSSKRPADFSKDSAISKLETRMKKPRT